MSVIRQFHFKENLAERSDGFMRFIQTIQEGKYNVRAGLAAAAIIDRKSSLAAFGFTICAPSFTLRLSVLWTGSKFTSR
jgi:hypothetical protein